MSLCEKGASKAPQNREIVFNQLELDVNSDYRILNLILSMDTGQATVQLQNKSIKPGLGAKLKPNAVILSEELIEKIKDEIIAEVYRRLEAKQVQSSIIQKIAEEQQALEIDISKIEKEYQEKIIDLQVAAKEAIKSLEEEKDLRKAVTEEGRIKTELTDNISILNEEKAGKIKEHQEAEREKVRMRYEPELEKVKKDYDIS